MLTSELQKIKDKLNSYEKPHLTYAKQLDRLKKNGLNVPNPDYAIKKLSHVNYYRLSAYFLPFQYPKNSEHVDRFFNGTEFNKIVNLYDFDAKLRRLVFGALEVIEVYIRTQIAYNHSERYGPFGYLEYENFNCSIEDFEKLIQDIKEESKRSDEVFVAHFKSKYNTTDLPLWSVVEVLSLGTVSRLFSMAINEDKQSIADEIGVSNDVLANWIHAMTILRNICAHHSRLWNKQLRIQFKVPRKNPLFAPLKTITKIRYINGIAAEKTYDNNASVFFALSVIKYMLDKIGEEVGFVREVKKLISEHPIVDLEAMGFVEDWEEENLWSEV